jgi:hypothetical protein
MRLIIALLFATIAIGCSTPAPPGSVPGVDLQISPSSPAPGEEVTLTLTNSTAGAIGYNLCASALTREVGVEWQPVPSDRVCTMELRTLEPAQLDSFSFDLMSDLPGGVYRFQTNIEDLEAGTRQEVATPIFLVAE